VHHLDPGHQVVVSDDRLATVCAVHHREVLHA
jgi:hypothetical protein